MSLVAGVDSSTQSCSVVVCDVDSGAVVRSSRAAHPPGTEVPAQAWWDAYAEATRDPALLAGVEAMAVGGQQHGMVTLDEEGALVRDALLWNDNRSAPDAVDLIAELGGAAGLGRPGRVDAGLASFTVTKLRWLARAEPDNAERTASVLLPHDWLTWQLGGRRSEPATDRGDASGTGYFDATAGTYRDDLVRLALGHDLRLPRVAAPDAVVGETADGRAAGRGHRGQHGRRARARAHHRGRRGLAGNQRHGLHHQPAPDPRPDRHGGRVRRRDRRVPAPGLHPQRGPEPGGDGTCC